MKKIKNFNATKYSSSAYDLQESGIYKCDNKFVTSLCFQSEPERGEGRNADAISQYPLEDVLDRFCVFVSDLYEELNTAESQTCYLEFSSTDIVDLRNLREIIGKHVYNRTYNKNGKHFVELIIE